MQNLISATESNGSLGQLRYDASSGAITFALGIDSVRAQFSVINENQFVQGCVMDMGKILRRIEILVDGTAVLCCDDATKLTDYGNVFELGIEKVWKNLQEEHKLIYDRVYSEAKKKLICNTCSRATFKIKEDQASTITGNQNTVLSMFNS